MKKKKKREMIKCKDDMHNLSILLLDLYSYDNEMGF